MKKIYMIAAMLLISMAASGQDASEIYRKWKKSKDVTAVRMTSKVINMVSGLTSMKVPMPNGKIMDLGPLYSSLDVIYVIDFKNIAALDRMVEDVNIMVRNEKYDLVSNSTNEGGQEVYIYCKGDKIIQSIVFFSLSSTSAQFLCMEGSIPRSELEELTVSSK